MTFVDLLGSCSNWCQGLDLINLLFDYCTKWRLLKAVICMRFVWRRDWRQFWLVTYVGNINWHFVAYYLSVLLNHWLQLDTIDICTLHNIHYDVTRLIWNRAILLCQNQHRIIYVLALLIGVSQMSELAANILYDATLISSCCLVVLQILSIQCLQHELFIALALVYRNGECCVHMRFRSWFLVLW